MKLLRVLLTSQGYDVRTAGDASDAMEVMKGFRPRLILMDIQLPGMSGLFPALILPSIQRPSGKAVARRGRSAVEARMHRFIDAAGLGDLTESPGSMKQ